MRHGSVVCTVTVYMPSGVPPLHAFRFPLHSSPVTKKASDTVLICKALAVQNMEKVWITSSLETYIFLPSGHHGYGSSSFCWIITTKWIGMWFILNQLVFNRVYMYIRFQFCPIFSACLKKRQNTSSLTQTLADLLSIGSNWSLF